MWQNFLNFPPLYQRVRIDTIQFNKHRLELYQSRLAKFVENTRKGIMYGEWNDNGRLLDYRAKSQIEYRHDYYQSPVTLIMILINNYHAVFLTAKLQIYKTNAPRTNINSSVRFNYFFLLFYRKPNFDFLYVTRETI